MKTCTITLNEQQRANMLVLLETAGKAAGANAWMGTLELMQLVGQAELVEPEPPKTEVRQVRK